MAMIEAELCFIKEDGRLIGFSVVAEPQAEAEFFCAAMPEALVKRTAHIFIDATGLVFQHPREGRCSFEIEQRDVETLKQLLEGGGAYAGAKLGLYRAGFLTPGFKIVLEGKQDAGVNSEPIRSHRNF